MEMPVFLPPNLDFCRASANVDELFHHVTNNSSDLIQFCKVAFDDETWCEDHPFFIQKILQFITENSFEDRLSRSDKKQMCQKIHEHYNILSSNLPLDISIEVEGAKIPENSLLFSSAGLYFEELIRNECLYKETKEVKLDGISLEFFKIIEEFVTRGEVPDLWKNQEGDLKNFRKSIGRFDFKELESLTENCLTRYINRVNVLSTLIQSHLDGWLILRHACYQYINELGLGIRFQETAPQFLAFEFLDFKENAMDCFNQVQNLITHLIFTGRLAESPEFSQVVNQCPLLTHLELGMLSSYSERIFDVPLGVTGFGLSSCNWLSQGVLIRVIAQYPHLKSLDLSDNIQLNYNSFGLLSRLKHLVSLDISKNPQISDDDFKLIMQSAPRLLELDCSFCKKIGDKGFFELTRYLNYLIFLNLERCNITDGILIEIAIRARYLEEINLTHCELLTDRGILELVRQAGALRKLIIRQCTLKDQTITDIKRLRNLELEV